SFACSLKCSVRYEIRSERRAIWTSGEPVSPGCRANFWTTSDFRSAARAIFDLSLLFEWSESPRKPLVRQCKTSDFRDFSVVAIGCDLLSVAPPRSDRAFVGVRRASVGRAQWVPGGVENTDRLH